MRGLIRRALPAFAFAATACGGGDPPVDAPAQFIAVRRAWQPGERAALLARIAANHEYNFPYVGDISDLAPQLYADTDSVVVMVPNPAFTASVAPNAFTGPGLALAPQFSASWNFVGAKITSINTSVTPPDTLFWHTVLWSDPSGPSSHGFVIAFSRAGTFNISQINSTTFDAGFGRVGAGAGEYHAATLTLWSDIGSGGNFQITSEVFPGAFSTISTGPYLGGVSRAGTIFGRVFNSTFSRVSGTELPLTFTISFDYRGTGLPSTEILCVFPTPCTTNFAGIAAASRR